MLVVTASVSEAIHPSTTRASRDDGLRRQAVAVTD